jgi:hypothetical protein
LIVAERDTAASSGGGSRAGSSTATALGALPDLAEVKSAARSMLNWALGIAASGVAGPCSRAGLSSSGKLANNSLLSKEAFTRRSFSSLQDPTAPNTRTTCAARHLERTSPAPQEDAPGPWDAPPSKCWKVAVEQKLQLWLFYASTGRSRVGRRGPERKPSPAAESPSRSVARLPIAQRMRSRPASLAPSAPGASPWTRRGAASGTIGERRGWPASRGGIFAPRWRRSILPPRNVSGHF